MTENSEILDTRIHKRLQRHFVKHGKKIYHHVRKHHKKYILGGSIYGISHILILKVFALKLLFLKTIVSGLALVGITNPSLTDIFAKMENICIDNHSIIAQQTCERDFATIQDAVHYLESTRDPETDTIYTAQYYGIIKSLLGDYCGKQIDQHVITTETKKIKDINKIKHIGERIRGLKTAHTTWKQQSLVSNFSGEEEFCTTKYLAYAMLDLSQTFFIKELRKQGLLSPTPIIVHNKSTSTQDKLILSDFAQRKKDDPQEDISYIVETGANDIAHIIKNITLQSVRDTLDAFKRSKLITPNELSTIKQKLELRFIESCDDIRGYHKINQYYSDNDVLEDTTLEEVKLDISLCDSYQYIDQLGNQSKKLFLHELGHYMYYFTDKNVDDFETICRTPNEKTRKNICKSNEFVSKYAQTNKEEDYAETFSRRALKKIFTTKHASAPETGTGSTNGLSKKFEYFDTFIKDSR